MRKAETILRTLVESLSAILYSEVRAMALLHDPDLVSSAAGTLFPGPWRVPAQPRGISRCSQRWEEEISKKYLFSEEGKSVKRETRQIYVLLIYVRNFSQGRFSFFTILPTLPACSSPAMRK